MAAEFHHRPSMRRKQNDSPKRGRHGVRSAARPLHPSTFSGVHHEQVHRFRLIAAAGFAAASSFAPDNISGEAG
jgi:hypothetical protein